MTELCELGYKYGTDKAGYYTHFYHTLFNGMRSKAKLLVEIGIGTTQAMKHVPNYRPGASLRMWRDYFPKAGIVGVDIDPGVMFQEERIHTAVIDQSNIDSLLKIPLMLNEHEIDIVIDDGSHNPEHQLLSLGALFHFVKKGGFYIIEDVNEPETVSKRLNLEHSVVSVRNMGNRKGSCIMLQK